MAKRMIDTKIWLSKQFGLLNDKAKLLYIGIITFADDDGRFQADTEILRSNVFPRDRIGKNRIGKLLSVIEKVGLIVLYDVDGEKFGHHPKWTSYQMIRSDRRKHSSFPPPPDTIRQPSDNHKAAKSNVIEVNIKKPKDGFTSDRGLEPIGHIIKGTYNKPPMSDSDKS